MRVCINMDQLLIGSKLDQSEMILLYWKERDDDKQKTLVPAVFAFCSKSNLVVMYRVDKTTQ